jgi:hypothetical protein
MQVKGQPMEEIKEIENEMDVSRNTSNVNVKPRSDKINSNIKEAQE